MLIEFKRSKGTLTIYLVGELDHHYAKHARDKIDAEIAKENTSRIIFDLSALTFMDSSGIGAILGRYKLMQSLGGTVQIVGVTPQIDKLLTVAGIKKLIAVEQA